MAALLPPDVARHAHCLTPDERAAVADVLRELDAAAPTTTAIADADADANASLPFLAAWRALTQRALHPGQPFALHRALHAAVYSRWDPNVRGPRPVWVPGPQEALETNAAAFMASWHGDAWWERARTGHPAKDWPLLQRVSVQSPELFWSAVLRDAIGVRFDAPPARVLDETGLRGDGEGGGGCCGGGEQSGGDACCSGEKSCCKNTTTSGPLGPDSVRWLPGARLNIAAAALLSPKSPDAGGGGAGAGGVDGPTTTTATSRLLWSAPCCDGEAYETTGASLSSPSSSPSPPAILWAEDGHPNAVRRVSWPALRARAARVARALALHLGVQPGDAVAIDMPMSCDAVAIYLGIVLSGAVVVSIADSFAPSEIAARLRISKAKLVFTQDVVLRGGPKPLPLYERVLEARAPRCVVLPASRVGKAWGADGEGLVVPLREGDVGWAEFLASAADGASSPLPFAPVSLPGDSPSNILFSSGTTGEPKAVVWSHTTPLRAAVDAWAHQDVRKGDVVCWPTNLGWMMGPWLVYGAFLNGAAVAIYHGAPGGMDFCAFVAAARVTQLGLVPSIVRSWRAAEGLLGPADEEEEGEGGGAAADNKPPYLPDWSALRCFSSTGEASAPDDYHWLASRVRGYRPVVEYCGGTEIGGGFLSGSLLQPQAAAAFSTPTLGAALVLLGSDQVEGGGSGGQQSPHGCGAPPFVGELTLVPPLLGSSQHLLNRDHFATYYAGMPRCLPPQPASPSSSSPCPFSGPPSGLAGRRLRRHGDEFARLPGGYYQALGRVDDTMNLGGIKVSSAELERCVLERVPGVGEAAAVGVPSPGGGPERLVLFVVLNSSSSAAAAGSGAAGALPAGAAGASGDDGNNAQGKQLEEACRQAVRAGLNPLFRVQRVVVVAALPRTASGKVVRRSLRDQAAAAGRL